MADGSGGTTVAWDAQMTEAVPNDTTAWRVVEAMSWLTNSGGSISRGPGDRVPWSASELRYEPPNGAPDRLVSKLFGKDARPARPDQSR